MQADEEKVVPPSTVGLDLTRWGWGLGHHVIQVRLNFITVHECAVNGLPQLVAEVDALVRRFAPAGSVDMRIYSLLSEHWCRADGSRLDTREGWFGCEVKVHAGSLTL